MSKPGGDPSSGIGSGPKFLAARLDQAVGAPKKRLRVWADPNALRLISQQDQESMLENSHYKPHFPKNGHVW